MVEQTVTEMSETIIIYLTIVNLVTVLTVPGVYCSTLNRYTVYCIGTNV